MLDLTEVAAALLAVWGVSFAAGWKLQAIRNFIKESSS